MDSIYNIRIIRSGCNIYYGTVTIDENNIIKGFCIETNYNSKVTIYGSIKEDNFYLEIINGDYLTPIMGSIDKDEFTIETLAPGIYYYGTTLDARQDHCHIELIPIKNLAQEIKNIKITRTLKKQS